MCIKYEQIAAKCRFLPRFQAFSAGFGIAIVPKIPLLDTMDVCVRPIISPEIERYIYLVLKKEKYLTPVVKDFISFITDQSEFA